MNGGYARPKLRRQSRYVIRLLAILAELCRVVHGMAESLEQRTLAYVLIMRAE
jgi:hypothetical protein